MAEEKNTVLKEVKIFKEGLEKIRREEILAEEAVAKARLEAKKILEGGIKKGEELIEQKKNEAEKESQELLKKTKDEAMIYATELKSRAEEDKKELGKKARTNLTKAVEFVVRKIMG